MSAKLPPQPMGVAPGSSYWNDWYEKLRRFVDTITTSVDWSIIINKPTTLAGYGITNGQTKINNSADLAAAVSDETGTGVVVFGTGPTINNINLTGTLTTAGSPGITVVIPTAKLTLAGTNGSMTFTNGVLTAQTLAT